MMFFCHKKHVVPYLVPGNLCLPVSVDSSCMNARHVAFFNSWSLILWWAELKCSYHSCPCLARLSGLITHDHYDRGLSCTLYKTSHSTLNTSQTLFSHIQQEVPLRWTQWFSCLQHIVCQNKKPQNIGEQNYQNLSRIICLFPCKYTPTMDKCWQCPDTIVQDREGWYLQLYNWLNEMSLVVKLTVKPGLHYLTNPCLYSCYQYTCYCASKMIHCHMASPLNKSVNPQHLIPVLSAAAVNVLLQLKSSCVCVTHKMVVMKKKKKSQSGRAQTLH